MLVLTENPQPLTSFGSCSGGGLNATNLPDPEKDKLAFNLRTERESQLKKLRPKQKGRQRVRNVRSRAGKVIVKAPCWSIIYQALFCPPRLPAFFPIFFLDGK